MFIGVKGESTAHHFVHDHTETPPIHGAPIVIIQKEFGRKVLRGATEGLRGGAEANILFAQTEVRYFNVTILVQ